jgi:hypothetical protein
MLDRDTEGRCLYEHEVVGVSDSIVLVPEVRYIKETIDDFLRFNSCLEMERVGPSGTGTVMYYVRPSRAAGRWS